jgi:gas vesicle protein
MSENNKIKQSTEELNKGIKKSIKHTEDYIEAIVFNKENYSNLQKSYKDSMKHITDLNISSIEGQLLKKTLDISFAYLHSFQEDFQNDIITFEQLTNNEDDYEEADFNNKMESCKYNLRSGIDNINLHIEYVEKDLNQLVNKVNELTQKSDVKRKIKMKR